MAVTISGKNYTLIDACESLTPWSGLTDALVSDFFKQGSYCLGMELWGSGTNDHTLTGTFDLSGTKHLRLWWMTTVLKELDTDANGGFQIGVSDGSNTGFYKVSGSTTYPGGWFNPVIDLSRAVDSGIKPVMASVTSIIFRWVLTAGAKKTQSCWIDHISVCDGLIAYGDDGGGYFDFEDIYVADNATTLGIGILRKISGQYFATGVIEIGDSAGINGCKFQAKSQVFVFEDRPVNASLYGFNIVDNGTGTTEFILGNKVGTAGIQGCTIRTASESQTAKFYIDGFTDTDVDNFKMYGSTLFDAGTITFGKAAATTEVLNCSFESCLQIIPKDAVTKNCFFINTSDVDAAILWNETINIETCSFIGNTAGAGIEMPSAVGTPYAYNGHLFSGNTYDVYNSSGSAISINKNNGSNPTTYEGSAVTFLGVSVTTEFTVIDSILKTTIQYVAVFVKASSGTGPLPFEDTVTITRVGDVATVSHTAHGLATNNKIEIEGANQNEYNRIKTITKIDDNSYSYPVYGSPATPATGTIKATGVLINGDTDVTGKISDTRALASDQPFTGSAKKGTSSPVYVSSSLSGTVDKDNGISVTVPMISD